MDVENRVETVARRERRRPEIKKLAPEMRRRRINFLSEPLWYKRLLWKWKVDSQFLRSTVQLAFALLCVWIGIEFFLFVKWGMSAGAAPFSDRPPGVEGFLPISALISLKYWAETGIINTVHPSGLFILIAIIAVSVAVKKAFCSWLCPVGTLSESLWFLGTKLFKKNLRVPRWLDYPLRSLKYLLFLFFANAIMGMDVNALAGFIQSPYNKMADVKMYLFFADLSTVALWTVLILLILSVVIKNFWCRYLCPYGALLGALSWLSPFKITREKSTCIDCELCTEACPADIKVHTAGRVWSDECTSCLRCVEVCPVKDTLRLRPSSPGKTIPTWVYGVLVVGMFVGVTGLAMLTNHWKNSVPNEEYLKRFQEIESPLYEHIR